MPLPDCPFGRKNKAARRRAATGWYAWLPARADSTHGIVQKTPPVARKECAVGGDSECGTGWLFAVCALPRAFTRWYAWLPARAGCGRGASREPLVHRKSMSGKSGGVQGETAVKYLFPSAKPTPYFFTMHFYLLPPLCAPPTAPLRLYSRQSIKPTRARTLRGRKKALSILQKACRGCRDRIVCLEEKIKPPAMPTLPTVEYKTPPVGAQRVRGGRRMLMPVIVKEKTAQVQGSPPIYAAARRVRRGVNRHLFVCSKNRFYE